jgi:hypothetical protein
MYKINKDFYPVIIINFDSIDNNDDTLEEYKKDYLKLLINAKKDNIKLIMIYNIIHLDVDIDTTRLYKLHLFFQSIKKENFENVRKICILNNNSSINLMIKSLTSLNKICDDVSFKTFSKETELLKYINNKYSKTIFLS